MERPYMAVRRLGPWCRLDFRHREAALAAPVARSTALVEG
jgi:hypothetical protein